MILPWPRSSIAAADLPGQHELAGQVDREDVVPVLVGVLGGRGAGDGAGVVDQDVDRPVASGQRPRPARARRPRSAKSTRQAVNVRPAARTSLLHLAAGRPPACALTPMMSAPAAASASAIARPMPRRHPVTTASLAGEVERVAGRLVAARRAVDQDLHHAATALQRGERLGDVARAARPGRSARSAGIRPLARRARTARLEVSRSYSRAPIRVSSRQKNRCRLTSRGCGWMATMHQPAAHRQHVDRGRRRPPAAPETSKATSAPAPPVHSSTSADHVDRGRVEDAQPELVGDRAAVARSARRAGRRRPVCRGHQRRSAGRPGRRRPPRPARPAAARPGARRARPPRSARPARPGPAAGRRAAATSVAPARSSAAASRRASRCRGSRGGGRCAGCPRRQAGQAPHQPSGITVTGSPDRQPVTPAPSAAIRPDISCPMTAGSPTRASMSPWKMCRSVPQMPV